MSSNDAVPRASDSPIDGAQASQTSEAVTFEPALQTQPQAQALGTESAAGLLALAERVVRWEDDTTAAELAVFTRLYQQVLQRARQELALPADDAEDPAGLAALSHAQARTALLRLRVDANVMVRRVAQAKPRSLETASQPHPLRYVIGVLVLLGLGAFMLRDAIVDQLDVGNISRGKPWRASSAFNASFAGAGTLDSFSEPFFFHTAQEVSPWIEVDLGAEIHVGSLSVRNRGDCCANRTVPLVVEASRDHNVWQVVATRQRNFSIWRPRVDATARFIRLRVLRESILHLRALIIRS